MTPGQAAYEARLRVKGERLRYTPQPDYDALSDDLRAEWEAAAEAAVIAYAGGIDMRPQVATEYAHRMSTGYLVRDPEAAKVYPLAEWIEDKRGDGSKVYRRRIRIIEDWAEVDPDDHRA